MKRFSNIVFVAQPDADNSEAFTHAVTLANSNQARITAVGLVDPGDSQLFSRHETQSALLGAMIDERREQLITLISGAPECWTEIDIKVLVGKGFIEIIQEVLRYERDLVIKSVEETQGIGEQLFGGTDMKLLRKCPCPVWLIKSTQQQGYRQILAAVDYEPDNAQASALNQQILEMATSLALSDSAELHVVNAWRLPYESLLRSPRVNYSKEEIDAMAQEEENIRNHWLHTLVSKYCAADGKEAVDYLEPQCHVIKGYASHVVPTLAKNLGVELVVMGTVSRTGIPGLVIGNTAERILGQIDCSVLTVKPSGFVSPVTLDG